MNDTSQSLSSNVITVQLAFVNIKILNDIQEKIAGINNLIELYKTSLAIGKVKALSSMYDNLSKGSLSVKPPRRNMSLPDFFDMKFYQCNQRNFNYDGEVDEKEEKFYKDEFNELSKSVPSTTKSVNYEDKLINQYSPEEVDQVEVEGD